MMTVSGTVMSAPALAMATPPAVASHAGPATATSVRLDGIQRSRGPQYAHVMPHRRGAWHAHNISVRHAHDMGGSADAQHSDSAQHSRGLQVRLGGPGTAVPGQTLLYTATIANLGQSTVRSVQLSLSFLPGMAGLTLRSQVGACTLDPDIAACVFPAL